MDASAAIDATSALDSGADGGDSQGGAGDIAYIDFENGTPGNACSGWQTSTATTSIASYVAHAGTKSCRICLTASNGFMAFQFPAKPPVVYTAELWMATLTDAGAAGGPDGGSGAASIRLLDDAGNYNGQMGDTATLTPGGWVKVQASEPATPGTAFGLVLAQVSPSAAGDCFYVDDVRIYAQ